MKINWTSNGSTGMSANGWMISKSASGFTVFDADDRLVGVFDTRTEAEMAVTA